MIKISADNLTPVKELFRMGLYLQAYEAASRLGPLVSWSGGEARVMAGRLAEQLGAPRMGQGHRLLAFREEPDVPIVRFYYAYTIWQRRGPYAAWLLLKKLGDMPKASPEIRAHWYALHGQITGFLRDFDTAESWQTKAEAILPDDAWLAVTRTALLEFEDRFEESLEAANRALSLRPWYRPAVLAAAHLRIQLGQDEEALALLGEADKYIECAAIVHQQIGLLVELRRYTEAKNLFERLIELMPLMEEAGEKWFKSMQADVSYFLNDFEAAVSFGRESEHPFFEKVAEHLEEPARRNAGRVVLPVAFVRQHHNTCVPATLTTISRFWARPAEHLEIANQICYNGTTAHNERRWAEQNGWLAREFTVTEESLAVLVDREVPFTLSLITPGNAHMQAVIGYDGRRGTMVVRDPYIRHTGEALIEEFLEEHGARGPRGMALVPVEEREKLEDLELPDVALWDQLHRFDGALERHRWPEAEQIYQNLAAQAPTHSLTLEARRRLAIYDANPVASLAAVDSLLEHYPDDAVLHLARLGNLSALGRRDELLEAYRALSTKKDSHPVFTQQFAQALGDDFREHDRAIRLLNHAIGKWPTEGSSYYILANLLWSKGRLEEALELYRFAICLRDKEEQFALAYFTAAHEMEQADEALAFLKKRWERFGSRSSLTARTLAWAYSQLGRQEEAINVLDEALVQHPEDGELKLEAADLMGQALPDNYGRAEELLAAARGKAPLRRWLRRAAKLSTVQKKPAAALAHWQKLLEIQPLAMDAHQATAQLLELTQDRETALNHLRKYAGEFPHYYPLNILLVEWYRELGRKEAFLETARNLVGIAPQNALSFGCLGEALLTNSEPEEAYKAFQKAFEMDPAYRFAGLNLFDLQFREGKLEAATETITLLAEHTEGPLVTARIVLLALREDDLPRVKEGLEKLCTMPDEGGWALNTVINQMVNARMGETVFEILDKLIKSPEAIPQVGAFWMRGCIEYGKLGCLPQLEELTARGAVGERATEAYLMSLVSRKMRFLLYDFVEKNHLWLRKSGANWSMVGYAFRQLGEREAALKWFRGWRQLPPQMAWMLRDAAEMFWEDDQIEDSVAVCQKALLLPPDHTTSIYRILLAGAAVFSRDVKKATGYLDLVNRYHLDAHSLFLYRLTDAAIQISATALPERQRVFKDVRSKVGEAVWAAKSKDGVYRLHRRFYRQTIKHVSREIGGIRGWLWYAWSYFQLR